MYTYIIYTTNMTPTADVKCDVNYNNIKMKFWMLDQIAHNQNIIRP